VDEMRVEITNSNASELIDLINKFPNGIVKVEDDKAYWVWEIKNQVINTPANYLPNAQPNKQKKGNTFFNMFDSLASRV